MGTIIFCSERARRRGVVASVSIAIGLVAEGAVVLCSLAVIFLYLWGLIQ